MDQLQENKRFWEQAWEDGRTRFHRDEVNSTLIEFAPKFFSPGARVLVPLCGKSIDLLWLATRGYGVTGVEIAHQPIQEFIQENQLEGQWQEKRYQVKGQRLTIFEQDFFHHDGRYDVIYDRACLVALPHDLRKRMSERYHELLMPEGKILLLTIVHNNEGGPPFSVTEDEVQVLFAKKFTIKKIREYKDTDRTISAYELVKFID